MIPYYLLVLVPFIIYFIVLYNGKKYNKASISSFFIILIILLSLRNIKVGVDLTSYKHFFYLISKLSFNNVLELSDKGEVLYYLLNKVVALITNNNYQIFLSVVAILSILPIFVLYYKKSSNALLTIALFITIAPFSMFFSGLRQSIAMGIVILSFNFIQDKKIFKYLLCILIAYLFHHSALFCILLYPLYNLKITKNWLYFLVPIILFIFIFKTQVFNFLIQFSGLYSDIYNYSESTGAYSILILLILFCLYCFIIPNKNKIDKEFVGLRNILLFAIFIQIFASINPVIMRLNYYNLLFIPILIPKIRQTCSNMNIRTINLTEVSMLLFFVFYFFYNAYTGNDILSIFPYIPFWEG